MLNASTHAGGEPWSRAYGSSVAGGARCVCSRAGGARCATMLAMLCLLCHFGFASLFFRRAPDAREWHVATTHSFVTPLPFARYLPLKGSHEAAKSATQ
jgi:hypothetical protein